ncbi:4-alpha-L-fucosyltransferase (Fuc4NAc transferase) [Pseudomonas sp. TMW22090]|uniref:TDP-N-acetylfucosamine:lipid II N-acetylfucosaminyltransferase n=1 Tax=Pseudomonas sp. TMW22090 TaxID=2506434 RepID=UPI001F0D298F|nr:TDP-N-acetylfucosamine:lipid II N-acetylfucosaminyltransferase [Pseudomonas sp. TMW22090]MCH4880462.1 4-alpha-L-fucosyltransferase (Fuc4NAc transferase) [Pseudomonas sp. TMW22090]
MKTLKILHLARDEKFIDQAIKAFEHAAPGASDLYVYSNKPLKLVKSRATIPSITSVLTGKISKHFSKYDLIIVHSLDQVWYKAILKLPKSIPVVWIGWGYDYYDIIYDSRTKTLLPLTSLELNITSNKAKLFKKIKNTLKKIVFPTNKSKVVERINFFSPVLPAEYIMVSTQFSGKKFPDYALWNYGNLEEDLVKDFTNAQANGSSILVGNSASAENNHLDSFFLLSNLGIDSREIISPLSYGDEQYRDLILKKGREQFGDRFEPLIDFMPIGDYVKILESCGFVIMNHIRQQAVGNIVIMLYLGAKIFLREECPTYNFFRDQGAVIFSIQELEKNPALIHEQLDNASMMINRHIVKNNWSKEVSDKKTRLLLKQVCNA